MSTIGKDSDGIVAQAARKGTVHRITVDADEAVAFLDIGSSPDATVVARRFTIPANLPEYFAVNSGDSLSASGSATNGATPTFGNKTTLVRVIYSAAAATVEVMECG